MVNAQPTFAALYNANPTDRSQWMAKVNLHWSLGLIAIRSLHLFFKDHQEGDLSQTRLLYFHAVTLRYPAVLSKTF